MKRTVSYSFLTRDLKKKLIFFEFDSQKIAVRIPSDGDFSIYPFTIFVHG